MNSEDIVREIDLLPPEGQRLVENYVSLLREQYADSTVQSARPSLREESFIGMWQDRDDLADSSAWVRGIRESEWKS